MSRRSYNHRSPRTFRQHLADRRLLKGKSPAKANAKQLVVGSPDNPMVTTEVQS